MTPVRIVKRKDRYCVQFGKRGFFTRKIKWVDASSYYSKTLHSVVGHTPLPITSFHNLEDAEFFCMKFLSKNKQTKDEVVKTYNTCSYDSSIFF